ncbi:hypothetical protein X733_04270 [Mesorhizobium sp. L2C067A000]|nr:hypothetical protein X733_04270 [Mesorhizobium sp. L2C067A000]
MVLCAKRRHDLIDSVERAGHESWVKKNEVDLSSQMHGPAQQSLRCRSGEDIACGARVQPIKSGKRKPIIESDFLASDPHFGKMRFQLDHIGIAWHPSIGSKQRAGASAENDVVLENRAILIRAVRNDLPTRAVAQETANLSSAQRAFGDRAAIGAINGGDTLKWYSDPAELGRDMRQPIARTIKIDHQTPHQRPLCPVISEYHVPVIAQNLLTCGAVGSGVRAAG